MMFNMFKSCPGLLLDISCFHATLMVLNRPSILWCEAVGSP